MSYQLILDGYNRQILNIAIGRKNTKLTSQAYYFIKNNAIPSSFKEEIEKSQIKFWVTLRTDRNEVLKIDDSFYINSTPVYEDISTPLEDLILISAKHLVDRVIDLNKDNVNKIIPRTCVTPLGANIPGSQTNIYTTVVVDHTLLKEDFFKIKEGKFVPIKSIEPKTPCDKEFYNNLTLVKE